MLSFICHFAVFFAVIVLSFFVIYLPHLNFLVTFLGIRDPHSISIIAHLLGFPFLDDLKANCLGPRQMAKGALEATSDMYEEYLYLTRDGELARKRNLDAVREHEVEAVEAALVEANQHQARQEQPCALPAPPRSACSESLAGHLA